MKVKIEELYLIINGLHNDLASSRRRIDEIYDDYKRVHQQLEIERLAKHALQEKTLRLETEKQALIRDDIELRLKLGNGVIYNSPAQE